jgi:hypothetical protein
MARRYDSSTTTFSPEGRLHQVEYAIEAINNAGTCVGILAKDGVVMATERRVTSGLLAPAKVRNLIISVVLTFPTCSWYIPTRIDLVPEIPTFLFGVSGNKAIHTLSMMQSPFPL